MVTWLARAEFGLRKPAGDIGNIETVDVRHTHLLHASALLERLAGRQPAATVVRGGRWLGTGGMVPEDSGAKALGDLDVFVERVSDVQVHEIDVLRSGD